MEIPAIRLPLLDAQALALGYGRVRVLDGVSFRIEGQKGTVVGLRGPNGTGKSTFLKACMGLHKPHSGSVKLMGYCKGDKAFKGVLSRLGYVPQGRPAGQLRLTADEVVWLGRYGKLGFLRPSSTADRDAVRTAMERCGVAHLGHRSVAELSGGQFQRVSIARALAAEPDVLLLDEPGTHLDIDGREGVERLVSSIAEESDVSMLVVSHDPALLSCCSVFLDFESGKVTVADA